MSFLPVTLAECRARGWDAPDFVYVTGDAYVDHPSFGLAIISRVLEKAGYRVAMLPQPDWHSCEDFLRFGRPRLGFLVTAGVIDSMVNHYTVAKKPRGRDVYSPGGKAGMRPDRATIVYANRIRQAYGNVPILLGGVEASLRRFAHYDYWDDRVRNSCLVDAGADVLMFGMGERSILRVAKWLEEGRPIPELRAPGTCVMVSSPPEEALVLPAMEEVAADRAAYARAFNLQYDEQDPVRGRSLCQKHGKRYLLQNPPDMPLSREELDRVYALPYERAWHPMYDKDGGVPALSEVKFSIAHVRGCFGACNFCALTFHQGRIVTSRSRESVLREATLLARARDFKGYIHDVGGPTANFRRPACNGQMERGACKGKQCLFPKPCKNLDASHREYVDILRALRNVPGVKKVFVRSGVRFDYALADADGTFLRELVAHHVSGQLKVAPEHISPRVLRAMGKPAPEVFERFVRRFQQLNEEMGLKQYLVPYFISSHPGCELSDAVLLAEYIHNTGQHPEQVQDFYPTPGTLSTAMFYTGLDPRDMKPVYVPRDPHEKALQRALMQYFRPENHALVLEALRRAGREDLIGFGRECLVPPRLIRREGKNAKGDRPAPGKPKDAPRKGGRPETSAARKGRAEKPDMPKPKKKRPAKPSPTGKRRV
ncbi:MAG TPA: YgiQ family radical SAM protein [Candidatus Pullichristensenella avicola]|nr:YgiQ family radical SAM protein [Candidatus Pullichristensenella avicola]